MEEALEKTHVHLDHMLVHKLSDSGFPLHKNTVYLPDKVIIIIIIINLIFSL